jgi:hypothetical protein
MTTEEAAERLQMHPRMVTWYAKILGTARRRLIKGTHFNAWDFSPKDLADIAAERRRRTYALSDQRAERAAEMRNHRTPEKIRQAGLKAVPHMLAARKRREKWRDEHF